MKQQHYFPAIISNGQYEIDLGYYKDPKFAREDIEYGRKFNEEFNANTFSGRCNKIICVNEDIHLSVKGEVDYHKMIIFPA